MSGGTRRTRQPRKPSPAMDDAAESNGSEATGKRKSTRMSTKPKLYDADTRKVSPPPSSKPRRPKAEKVFEVEETDSFSEDDNISPKSSLIGKKELLLSPGSALAGKVGELSISKRSSTAPKKSVTSNLKTKLATQRTTEKKARSPSPVKSERTPEKKQKVQNMRTPTMKKTHVVSDSDSDDDVEEKASSSEKQNMSGPLKGRLEEFNAVKNWILESKAKKTSLSIYISGQPGTGKTATTMRVLGALGSAVRSCLVNCASTSTKPALFKTIFETLGFDGKRNAEVFEEHVRCMTTPLVLVLDEIDHLATRSNTALYAAFQWPDTLSHKIIILGIANSIDLTERLLPKLMLVKPPKRLVFEPYTKDDIVEILHDKLKNEEVVVDSKAIELTARKVAAMSGDLRTALHIFKQQKSRLMDSGVDGAPPATPTNGCREVLGIINSVYSSPLARARLPLQPRILLAVSLALSSNKKSSFDRNSLHRAYFKACEAIRVPALDDDDLHSAFQTLESQSFIRQLNGGKLVLQVDAPTAKSAISDNAMLDQIALLNF